MGSVSSLWTRLSTLFAAVTADRRRKIKGCERDFSSGDKSQLGLTLVREIAVYLRSQKCSIKFNPCILMIGHFHFESGV